MQMPELRDGDTWTSSVDRKAYPDRHVTDAGWGVVHFIEEGKLCYCGYRAWVKWAQEAQARPVAQ